jgi:type IV pilus assembly protein PilE
MSTSASYSSARGFTLIELMVTIVIAATLLSIAVPSYMQQIRKSRRTEARAALLDLAGREERFYSTNNTYSQQPADLGYPGKFPQNVGSGYYSVNVVAAAAGACPGAAAGATATCMTYSLTAQPTTLGNQQKDTQCATFTLIQTGQQSSVSTTGVDTSSTCWN